jgi:filamentous hemagglutinin family protein
MNSSQTLSFYFVQIFSSQVILRLILLSGMFGMNGQRAIAQITPDATLPTNSVVTTTGATRTITGGTRPIGGNNLFHSFSEFSVPTGSTALFDNATDIQNIFTRVTGSSLSEIDGIIRANGSANLFLLNPNGILFGPNAQLNIGGTFIGSTANNLRFLDGTEFNAVNPTANPLLTVSVPMGLQFGVNPGNITVNGTDAVNTDLTLAANQGFLLAGNNLRIENTQVNAPGGHIELASISGAGIVGLSSNVPFSPFRFMVPTDIPRGDISTLGANLWSTTGTRGGSMALTAQNISLSGDGLIRGGVQGIGSVNVPSGDITLDVRDALDMDYTVVTNRVNTNSVGNAGNINVTTGSLSMMNGAQFTATLRGRGSGGNITINARDTVSLSGYDVDGLSTLISSSVRSAAVGNGGKVTVNARAITVGTGGVITGATQGAGNGSSITLNADTIDLLNGGQINTTTTKTGHAGDIVLNANQITLAGDDPLFSQRPSDGPLAVSSYSGIYADAEQAATNAGGSIRLNAAQVTVRDGGQINANTTGGGNAGSLDIRASGAVEVSGVASFDQTPSRLTAGVSAGATGNGGGLAIATNQLRVTNGGQISTATAGIGNAGNTTVNADLLSLLGGGQIRTGTNSSGNSGTLTVTVAGEITAIGESITGQPSGLFTDVGTTATGQGGNLNVNSDRITFSNGATISAGTNGAGNAGMLMVNTNIINLTGESGSGLNTTGFSTSTTGTGQGGNLTVMGNRLHIHDGAAIRTGTFSSGNSGDLSVRVDRINISSENILRPSVNPQRQPGGLSTAVNSPQATGQGGDLSIVSDRLTVSNLGQISATTLGIGDAGNVSIRADQINIIGSDAPGETKRPNSGVFTIGAPGSQGNGGDIHIFSDRLSVRNGGSITAATVGAGNAGDLNIRAQDIELRSGDRNRSFTGLFSTAGFNSTGDGGNVTIRGDRLQVLNGALIATGTFSSGDAGNILLRVDDIEVSGSSPNQFISALTTSVNSSTATGHGGSIRIEGDRLSLRDGGQIAASTVGRGSAGNITVNVRSVALSGIAVNAPTTARLDSATLTRNSSISAAAVSSTGNNAAITGSAGSVTVNADTLRVSDRAALSVSSLGSGNAGNLRIRANSVQLNDGGILQAETNAGNQGNIIVNAPSLVLSDRSRISTNAQGTATGGNLRIGTEYLFALGNSDITANSISNFGGRVKVKAEGIFGAEFRPQLTPGNDITASSGLGTGFSGTVELQTPNVSPTTDNVELPESIIDPSNQIAAVCNASSRNTFVVTGRGGIAESPYSAPRPSSGWADIRDLDDVGSVQTTDARSTQSMTAVVEAGGWSVDGKGQVQLVARSPEAANGQTVASCAGH